jgi:hypothetical protein
MTWCPSILGSTEIREVFFVFEIQDGFVGAGGFPRIARAQISDRSAAGVSHRFKHGPAFA